MWIWKTFLLKKVNMDFELEQYSPFSAECQPPTAPPPPHSVMLSGKTIYFPFLNQLVYSIICNTRIKKMMTPFFQNDMAFGTTDDIIIFQLASLYHNRHTLFWLFPNMTFEAWKNYDMIILTVRLCNIGLHYFDWVFPPKCQNDEKLMKKRWKCSPFNITWFSK